MPEFFEADLEQEELPFDDATAKILVIGVGGGGGNAVNHMIKEGIKGVDFLAINTDAQALRDNRAEKRMLLYSESLGKKRGLGAGGKPERAREAAEASEDELRERLQGYDMVFITAGMGGGTGTGAASVIARVAKDMGILTVGVITKPSEGEGGERLKNAEEGIAALEPHVDALLVILNDKLRECLAVPRPTLLQCFAAANDVLKNAVSGIVEIITVPGLINVDFNDVSAVLESTGRALMGVATIPVETVGMNGQGRASVAVQQAIRSPLLEGIDFSTAKSMLLNITAPADFQMDEVDEALSTVKGFTVEGANIIHGVVIDETMGDSLRVTVIATGLDAPAPARQPQSAQAPIRVVAAATGTNDAQPYGDDTPAVLRRNHGNSAVAMARASAGGLPPLAPLPRSMMIGSGRDGVMRRDGGNARPSTETNPPAFLMKQAD